MFPITLDYVYEKSLLFRKRTAISQTLNERILRRKNAVPVESV